MEDYAHPEDPEFGRIISRVLCSSSASYQILY